MNGPGCSSVSPVKFRGFVPPVPTYPRLSHPVYLPHGVQGLVAKPSSKTRVVTDTRSEKYGIRFVGMRKLPLLLEMSTTIASLETTLSLFPAYRRPEEASTGSRDGLSRWTLFRLQVNCAILGFWSKHVECHIFI